jgi:hypothetical protein
MNMGQSVAKLFSSLRRISVQAVITQPIENPLAAGTKRRNNLKRTIVLF